MNAQAQLTKINELIAAGKTVTFVNGRSAIEINAKTVARFAKAGYEVLKVINNELQVVSGRSYKSVRFHAVYTN